MNFLPQFLMVACWLLGAGALGRAEIPLEVGDRKQLFIDRRFIQASENVALTMNPAQKLGVVFKAETNAYARHPLIVGNAFEDGGKFKMYYGEINPAGHSLAYAESTDALHWTRPNLGLVKMNGQIDSNVIMGDQDAVDASGAFVFRDDHDQGSRRPYKLFVNVLHPGFKPEIDGVYAYDSEDGLRFQRVRRVLPLYNDNPSLVCWDPHLGKYVIFVRALVLNADNQRQVARIVTDDPMQPWPFATNAPDARGFISPSHVPVVLKADDALDPFSDIYYNNGCIYPWGDQVYLMFPTPFRHFAPNRQPWFRFGQFEKGGDFGLLETQFAASRDGIHWERYGQLPYFPMGLGNEWDRWYTVLGRGMIRHGNYLYQYYVSGGHTHDGGLLRAEHDRDAQPGAMGVIRQRLDGFVSADAGIEGGWILTPPLIFKGQHLRLNIDTGAMGSAFVEVRDAEGKPIPGFTLAEAEEVAGNYIDELVYWKGSNNVSSLAGRPVRLYFKLKRAKLFAFGFANGSPSGGQ
jgi:hypothetical protein